MATTTQAEDIEPTPAAPPAGPKKHADVETQGLEKVTDYVEEQEIGELTEVREMFALGFTKPVIINIDTGYIQH